MVIATAGERCPLVLAQERTEAAEAGDEKVAFCDARVVAFCGVGSWSGARNRVR